MNQIFDWNAWKFNGSFWCIWWNWNFGFRIIPVDGFSRYGLSRWCVCIDIGPLGASLEYYGRGWPK